MSLCFRVFAIFILFAVHSSAIFWVTVALAGVRPGWRRYFMFYAGYCVVEWGAVLLLSLFDLEEEAWWQSASFLIVALILCVILRLADCVSLVKALGAAALGHFLTFTIFDFLTEAAVFYSPVFDGKYLYVATSQ